MSGDKRLFEDVERKPFTKGTPTPVSAKQPQQPTQTVQQAQQQIPQKKKKGNGSDIKTLEDLVAATPEQQKAFFDMVRGMPRSAFSQANSGDITNKVMEILGSNKAPTVIDEDVFDKWQKLTGSEVLYRGVTSRPGADNELFADEKNIFVQGGMQFHGAGTYFFAGKNFAGTRGHITLEGMLRPTAKVFTVDYRSQAFRDEYNAWAKSNGLRSLNLGGSNPHLGLFALARGYDAMRIIGGNSFSGTNSVWSNADKADYVVVLNRGQVIYKKIK
ncbi:MAG: hypothetical protein J5725_03575 [Bacteroidales bacterium]|nr:hypothetical protein [Bacteroidales bacterium]